MASTAIDRVPGRDGPIRVLHCPDDVAGNASGLARAERELGLESHAVTLRPHPFGFESEEVLFSSGDNTFSRTLKRWALIWRAIRNFDVVHFNFGQSVFRSRRDLPLFKAAGKVVVVTYQGSDARQADRSRELFDITPYRDEGLFARSHRRDSKKRKRIAAFDRWADCIFSVNPDLCHVLPARTRFLPYSSVFPEEWTPPDPSPDRETPLVIHAPSNRELKGTAVVLDAVDRLRRDGARFEFRLVEGLPHSEARALYATADLLIDQVLLGWYGALSVELMAMAKPVICYLREEDMEYLPAEMRRMLPVINARPDTLYDVLKDTLGRGPGWLRERGRLSRQFVERWHDPRVAAGMTRAAYESAILERAGAGASRLSAG